MKFVSTRNCGQLALEQTAQKEIPFFPYPINWVWNTLLSQKTHNSWRLSYILEPPWFIKELALSWYRRFIYSFAVSQLLHISQYSDFESLLPVLNNFTFVFRIYKMVLMVFVT